jgi:hypothetical protein
VLGRRRFPIVIEARESGASGWATVTHQNLMATHGIGNNVPRIFIVDRSGYLPTDAAGGFPRPPLGDYIDASWGGPRSGRDHALAEFDINGTFGEDAWVWQSEEEDDDDGDGAAGGEEDEDGDEGERARVRSAFRIASAIAEQECVGYFDGFNAYDNSIFSYPPFHFTLGRGDGTPALMSAFVAWLQRPDEDVIEAATDDEEQRDELLELIGTEYQRAFGHFGVGANEPFDDGVQDVGFLNVGGLRPADMRPGDDPVDMTAAWNRDGDQGDRQKALYQAYCQWFRTWSWFARFARGLRGSEELRRLLVAYSLEWAEQRLSEERGGEIVGERLSSERAAAYLRLFVYRPNLARNGFDALPARDPNLDADEAEDPEPLLRELLLQTDPALNPADTHTDSAVFDYDPGLDCDASSDDTACNAAKSVRHLLGLDAGDDLGTLSAEANTANPDQLLGVRDRLLRSLVADGPPDPEDGDGDEGDDGDAPEGN